MKHCPACQEDFYDLQTMCTSCFGTLSNGRAVPASVPSVDRTREWLAPLAHESRRHIQPPPPVESRLPPPPEAPKRIIAEYTPPPEPQPVWSAPPEMPRPQAVAPAPWRAPAPSPTEDKPATSPMNALDVFAFFFSFCLPGLGQLLQGKWRRGLFYMISGFVLASNDQNGLRYLLMLVCAIDVVIVMATRKR